jgi:hypothetical protein
MGLGSIITNGYPDCPDWLAIASTGVLYAGAETGVFKSADGGGSWQGVGLASPVAGRH